MLGKFEVHGQWRRVRQLAGARRWPWWDDGLRRRAAGGEHASRKSARRRETSLADDAQRSWSVLEPGSRVQGTSIPASALGVMAQQRDVLRCTVDHRKPQSKVVKPLDPAADAGKFEFTVNGVGLDNAGAGYGDGGTTGFVDAQLAGKDTHLGSSARRRDVAG